MCSPYRCIGRRPNGLAILLEKHFTVFLYDWSSKSFHWVNDWCKHFKSECLRVKGRSASFATFYNQIRSSQSFNLVNLPPCFTCMMKVDTSSHSNIVLHLCSNCCGTEPFLWGKAWGGWLGVWLRLHYVIDQAPYTEQIVNRAHREESVWSSPSPGQRGWVSGGSLALKVQPHLGRNIDLISFSFSFPLPLGHLCCCRRPPPPDQTYLTHTDMHTHTPPIWS